LHHLSGSYGSILFGVKSKLKFPTFRFCLYAFMLQFFGIWLLLSCCVLNASADSLPAIFNVSDAVTAGTSFNLNGSSFILSSLAVAVEFDTNGTSPATPDLNAAYCSVLVTDKLANFLIARMPDVGTNGVFNCWVGTTAGWSTPIKLNVARPLFLSDYQTFSNGIIEVVGRNFDQREFNGQGRTLARLNNGSTFTTNIAIKDYNPYHMTLLMSNQPVGTYYVEVSNDSGTNWSRTTSGQTLQVLSYPSGNFDPLGLGVEWAKDFNWNNVYNVTNYGVTPNVTNDCTSAVQTILNSAESGGGGVVYFPAGSYYLHFEYFGANVVIEGAGKTNTILNYNAQGGSSLFKSRGSSSLGGIPQLQGIANLSVQFSVSNGIANTPDTIFYVGDFGGSIYNSYTRTGNRLFISGVSINYPYSAQGIARGIGLGFMGNERILVQNNTFTGWYADIPASYVNNYCIIRNNSFEYSDGYVQETANYSFFETNTLNIHGEYHQDCHGLFGRANAYMCGNYVNGAGDNSNAHNDGEALDTDLGDPADLNYGRVISATSTALTVAPVVALTNPETIYYGTLSVYITYGTGIGQMRPVTAIDTNANVITVSPAFTVTPDSTSTFTLYCPLNNETFYANTATNCAKGIWPFGNQYDTVVANNTTVNCNGIFIYSARVGSPAHPLAGSDRADAFVRICRNTVVGVSRRSNQGGIGLTCGRVDSANFFDTLIYATQMVSNSISGNSQAIPIGGITEAPPYSGIYLSSYPYSTLNKGTDTGDITDTIIEGNQLDNLMNGATVTKCNYGSYINNNFCTPAVLNSIVNGTSQSDNMVNQW
jgi:hypothetical protein